MSNRRLAHPPPERTTVVVVAQVPSGMIAETIQKYLDNGHTFLGMVNVRDRVRDIPVDIAIAFTYKEVTKRVRKRR